MIFTQLEVGDHKFNPFFIAIFLIATGGDPILAVTLLSVFSAFFLSFFLFKTLNIKLSNFYSSILTLFILLTPQIISIYQSFFSEIIYLPLSITFFYFLLKSNTFEERNYSILASIFLALTICVRPAESLLFVIAIIPFIYISYKRKITSLNDILVSFNFLLVTMVLFFYITYVLPYNKIILYISAITVFLFTFLFIKSNNFKVKNFCIFSLLLCSICFIYWIPAIDKLLNWIFEASSGSVAQSLAWHFRSQTLLDLSTTIINNFGNVILLFIIATPIILFCKDYGIYKEKEYILIGISILFFLFLILGSYTFFLNDGQIGRRILFLYLIFSVFMSWILFNNKVRFRKIPLCTFIIIIVFSFSHIIHSSMRINSFNIGASELFTEINKSKIGNKYFSLSNNISMIRARNEIDPHIILSNQLARNACVYDTKDCLAGKKIFISMPLIFDRNTIDPFTLSFVNNSLLKNNFWLGYVLITKGDDPISILRKNKVQYILLENKDIYTQKVLEERGNIGSAEKFTSEILQFDKTKFVNSLILIKELELQNTSALLFKLKEEI